MAFTHGPLAIHRRRSRGQTLVIFALMSITLFGFAGLALDAGHIYLMYRLAQNATDSAALAGGKRLSAAIRGSQPSGLSDPIVLAVHDYAQANGFLTNTAGGCASTTAGTPRLGLTQFTATWVDTGTCAAGFTTRVTATSPPPTLTANCSNVPYNCMAVTITQVVPNFLMGVLGIPTTTVTTSATVLALPPGNVASMPPSIAVYLYQPDINPLGPCIGPPGQCKKLGNIPQWFDPTIPPQRGQLTCSALTSSCPTFWAKQGSSPLISGIDGHNIPTGDIVALESNGSMVLQDRTTFCDPYGGACSSGTVTGLRGFSLQTGKTLYCTAPLGQAPIACTPVGPGAAPLNANFGNETSYSSFSWQPLITAPTNSCGSLVLDGDIVANSGGSGNCNPPAADPYLILPGVYGSIVVNHGLYEFGPGVFTITGTALQNTAPAGQKANGIDLTGETAADWDLCPSGSCPGWNPPVGLWIGHGNTPFVNGAAGSGESCGDGSSGPPTTGGGDQTWIKGAGVTFQFAGPGSGGFVSTNEVNSISLSAPGLGTQPATGGVPILFDLENSTFIHLDAASVGGGGGDDGGDGAGNVNNQFVGIIYQTTGANAGGVEVNAGLGGTAAAIRGQVLAYTYTAFGIPGAAVNFVDGFGVGSGPPPTSTGGFNETQIYATPAATLTAPVPARAGFETLTWHYTDEWKLDAYTTYVKINNTTPVYFSQGIWNPAPGAGVPLPPSGNTPGETSPAYPSVAQDPGSKYTHTFTSNNTSDWTMRYSDGSTLELNGGWVWGHENAISGSSNGTDVATGKYTFPTPPGLQSTITLFMSDGDRCGDWVTVTVTLNNVGTFNPGLQTVGTVTLEQ
jgi:Flp pilus assembly protein TadG